MNRLNIQRQADRRDEILSAAQRCFVRSGFHQTSMQEICTEAGMSAGNLYRYFPSKETIIAGIAERDRAAVHQAFARADPSQRLAPVPEGRPPPPPPRTARDAAPRSRSTPRISSTAGKP